VGNRNEFALVLFGATPITTRTVADSSWLHHTESLRTGTTLVCLSVLHGRGVVQCGRLTGEVKSGSSDMRLLCLAMDDNCATEQQI